MITILIFSIVVFRAELAPMGCVMVLYDIHRKKYTFARALVVAIAAFLVSVLMTVTIDSYFWKQEILWPELKVFLFNGTLNALIS